MGTTVSRLEVWIGAQVSELESGLRRADAALGQLDVGFAAGAQRMGASMSNLGAGMTAMVTLPIAAGFKYMTDQAGEAEQVMAQTQAAIRSTGGAAGVTAAQISQMAQAFSENSNFADDAVQKGENLLLTFTNIGSEVFPMATQAMLDMATAMDTDASAGAIQLGKALNDPTEGLTALTRVGVTFTEAQKAQIKTMQETGDMAGAQKIILAELNREFGGSAAAQVNTYAGQMAQLKNTFDNTAEALGGVLLPMIGEWAGKAQEAALAVQGWTPAQQKLAVEMAALAAAAGPAMFATGKLVGGIGSMVQVLGAAPKLLADTAFGIQALQAGQGVFSVLSTGAGGWLAVLGPVTIAVGALAAVWVVYEKTVKKATTEGMAGASSATTKLLAEQKTAQGVLTAYNDAVKRMGAEFDKANPLVTGFMNKQAILTGGFGDLSTALQGTTTDYAGYRANMEAAAAAQGLTIDANGNLIKSYESMGRGGMQTSTMIVQANVVASESQYELSRTMEMVANIGDTRKEDIAEWRDATRSMVDPALDAAGALIDQKMAMAEFQAVMGGAVDNELASYQDKQRDIGQQLADTKAELDKLMASQGQHVTLVDEAKYSAEEYQLQLQNVSAAEKALTENTDADKALGLTVKLQNAKEKADEMASGLGGMRDVTIDNGKKIDELKGKYGELSDTYSANADAHDLATRRIMLDLLTQQLALQDGGTLSAAHQAFVLKVGENWGVVEKGTATAWNNIADIIKTSGGDADAFIQGMANRMPGYFQDINFNIIGTVKVNGNIPYGAEPGPDAPVVITPEPDNGAVNGMRGVGGPVWPSGSFVVGETGPEIFSPTMAGMITPSTSGNTSVTGDVTINVSGVSDPNAAAAAVVRQLEDRGLLSKTALR